MWFESTTPTTGTDVPLMRNTGMSRISITAEHAGRTIEVIVEEDLQEEVLSNDTGVEHIRTFPSPAGLIDAAVDGLKAAI
jgi:hypothetical protein